MWALILMNKCKCCEEWFCETDLSYGKCEECIARMDEEFSMCERGLIHEIEARDYMKSFD